MNAPYERQTRVHGVELPGESPGTSPGAFTGMGAAHSLEGAVPKRNTPLVSIGLS